MERIDLQIDKFMEENNRYPEYLLVSPVVYEEIKDFLGIDIAGYVTSYKDIQLYVSPGFDPQSHIVLL